MHEKPDIQSNGASGAPVPLMVDPAFMLLFSIHLKGAFNGFGALPPAIAPRPPAQSGDYVARLAEFETRLLGKTFQPQAEHRGRRR